MSFTANFRGTSMADKRPRYQYEITRQGFVEHVNRGDISWDAFNLHHWLRLHCRKGIIHTCAASLAPTIRKSVRCVQRWLRELEKHGYTNGFRRPGRRGAYPILIHKYETWNGTEAVRLNAHLTRDWHNPIYDRVTDGEGETWGDVVGEASGEASGELTPLPLLTTTTTPLRQVPTTTTARGWPCEQCGEEHDTFDEYVSHVVSDHSEILPKDSAA